MRKNILLCGLAMMVIIIQSAIGDCSIISDGGNDPKPVGGNDCLAVESKRYVRVVTGSVVEVYTLISCATCPVGVQKVTSTFNPGNVCSSSYTYSYCDVKCNTNNCSSTDWTSIPSIPYQTRTYKYCYNDECLSESQVRCQGGYYGSPTAVGSGCTQCPTWTGVYTNSSKTTLVRGISNAGASTINGCFVGSGTYYDSTGTFKITGNCSYK